ncbi:DUF4190 domain-containing protein [Actinomadura chokoriensis]|uniref:DUF4190 domain-containing protein n=1 Tax=Actinomadura chokoriensis TaxID=454156 RepID=A0ABV4R0E4_9ACTN
MSEQRGREVSPDDRPDGRPAGEPPAGPSQARQTGLRALWLGGIALLTSLFFYPLGLVLGIAALVVGIKARRQARATRDSVPGAVPGMVMGAIGLATSVLMVAMAVFLRTEFSGYWDCVNAANTNTDQQVCRDEYYPQFEDKLDLPPGWMDRYGHLL